MGSCAIQDASREDRRGNVPPECARRMRRVGCLSKTPDKISRVMACKVPLGQLRSENEDLRETYGSRLEGEPKCKRQNMPILLLPPRIPVHTIVWDWLRMERNASSHWSAVLVQ